MFTVRYLIDVVARLINVMALASAKPRNLNRKSVGDVSYEIILLTGYIDFGLCGTTAEFLFYFFYFHICTMGAYKNNKKLSRFISDFGLADRKSAARISIAQKLRDMYVLGTHTNVYSHDE